jgi:hypothetical protein
MGRAKWLSRDPIEEKGGLNLYGFVQNHPMNRVDPRGLDGFPKMTHKTFYDSSYDTQRPNWFKHFRKDVGGLIKDSAWRYCVPKRLLAAVVANEMIDWDSLDGTILDGAKGGGIGFAQISVSTSIKEGLMGYEGRYNLENPNHLEALVNQEMRDLRDPGKNIDAAARLMKKYLRELCSRARNNSFGAGLASSAIFEGCGTDTLCCSGKLDKCRELYEYKPSTCLLKMMAATWNSPKVLDAKDKVTEDNFRAANYMGLWITDLEYYIEELVK